jgi:death on curing protein
MAVLLGLNGYDLRTSESDVVTTIVALAAGNVDEAELAEWVRGRIRKRP